MDFIRANFDQPASWWDATTTQPLPLRPPRQGPRAHGPARGLAAEKLCAALATPGAAANDALAALGLSLAEARALAECANDEAAEPLDRARSDGQAELARVARSLATSQVAGAGSTGVGSAVVQTASSARIAAAAEAGVQHDGPKKDQPVYDLISDAQMSGVGDEQRLVELVAGDLVGVKLSDVIADFHDAVSKITKKSLDARSLAREKQKRKQNRRQKAAEPEPEPEPEPELEPELEFEPEPEPEGAEAVRCLARVTRISGDMAALYQGASKKEAPKSGTAFVLGDRVQAKYPSGSWYDATIVEIDTQSLQRQMFWVNWDDGDTQHRRHPAANLRKLRGATAASCSGSSQRPSITVEFLEPHGREVSWMRAEIGRLLSVHDR